MSALADLPSRQRACVVLRYFEDLSVADTATVLGCTEGTVKSQTSRALVSLRSMFDGSPLGELVTEGAPPW
jgi:RNA polymerase sigma factor (sigma-70 family)